MELSPEDANANITGNPQICTGLSSSYLGGKNEGCVKDSCYVGNPINLGTGNKFQIETDYVGAGPFPLVLKRAYNSAASMQPGVEVIGSHWRNHYERRVYYQDPLQPDVLCAAVDHYTFTINGWSPRCDISTPLLTSATVSRPDGKTVYFVLGSNGVGTPDSDINARLIKTMTGWQYTSDEDEIENYDTSGLLLSITNRAGLTHTLGYDTAGHLQSVTDPFGRALTFTYDASNRVSTVADPDGGVYIYAYDAKNNLSTVTYPDTKTRTYLYENTNYPSADYPNALTGILDENGNRFATWVYDMSGLAISSEHAGGVEKETVVYNNIGTVRATAAVTDAAGVTRTFSFVTTLGIVKKGTITQPCIGSGCGGATTNTSRNKYDAPGYANDYANGNVTSKTDFNGIETTYTYNITRNLEISRTEASGTTSARTISTQWHPIFRLPTSIAEPLKITTYTHDANGNVLSKSEQTTTDVNGSQSFAATSVGTPRTWTYTYNTFGQVLILDGPRTDVNDTTTYTYDPINGNLLTITSALNQVTQITHHDASGRPLRTIDPNGLVTQITYTPRGWTDLIKVGTDTVYETTDLDYDGVGQLIKATLPDGSYLSYTYDAAHRLTDISDSQGNTIHYTLDLMGNRTATEVKDPSGTLKRSHRNVYNTLNKLTQGIGADKGPDTQTTYYDEYDANGNLKKMRDAQGNITQYGYDAFNRLTTTLDALNGATSYSYDAQGNLSTVTDPRGNITTYHHDGLGNLTQLNSPDTGTTNYTAYDGAGNLLSQTDAKGQTTQYQYDALNRLTQITYADNSTTVYSYDQGSNSTGRLTAATDPTGSTHYQYDLHGRITKKDYHLQPQGTIPLGYHYNAAGQLDQVTYPSGLIVGYGYHNGRINSITLNGQTLMNNINYSPFGPVSGWTWATGATVNRSHDLDGQLQSHTQANATKTLTYNNLGNLSAITDTGNAANDQTFSYDALQRLISANGPHGPQSYSYDPNGNRTETQLGANHYSYATAAQNNRLQSTTGPTAKTYSHDANGNITSDGQHSYSHNARNRLSSIDNDNVTYHHNALGQRIIKQRQLPANIPGDIDQNNTLDNTDLYGEYFYLYGHLSSSPAPNADCDANGQINNDDLTCIQTKITNNSPGPQGDIVPDGVINDTDYLMLTYHLAGRAHTPLANSDCNSDTTLNANDVYCILGHVINADWTAKIYYLHDESGHLISEINDRGAIIQETIYLEDLPVAVVKGNAVQFIYADHLNTPRAITNINGGVVWRWESDPFGTTAPDEDPDGDGVRYTYNLRFPGQVFDQETGLHYNYFRDYDPSTGRFVQSDPIGISRRFSDPLVELSIGIGIPLMDSVYDVGVNHTYGYARQNPMMYMDFYGFLWIARVFV
jgi:RHS repeat-associated protein